MQAWSPHRIFPVSDADIAKINKCWRESLWGWGWNGEAQHSDDFPAFRAGLRHVGERGRARKAVDRRVRRRRRSGRSCRRSSRRRSSTRRTASRSSSRSARPTPIPRNSIRANSSSAAARRCCTVGLADIRGVKVTYLFNLFDYWGAVVTSRPEIKTLEGPRRQGPRRRQGHHQLRDVRLVRPAARRRHLRNFPWSTPRPPA